MISQSTRAALKDPHIQETFDYHQNRLRDLFAGKSVPPVFVLNGIGRYTEDDSLDWETIPPDDALDYLASRAQDACNREGLAAHHQLQSAWRTLR